MAYKIKIKPSAIKDLDSIPDIEVRKISVHFMQLEGEPRPIGVQKLSAKKGYRIRSGNYRVLYEINDESKTVFVFRIKHRKEAYK